MADLTYLQKVCAGNDAMIGSMINLFLEETPQQLVLMKDLLANENWEELGLQAHKLKSSASIMGLPIIAENLKNIEAWTKSKDNFDGIATAFESVFSMCKTAYLDLEKLKSAL